MRFKKIVLFFALLVSAIWLGRILLPIHYGNVSVNNISAVEIKSGGIDICRKHISIGRIPSHSVLNIKYRVMSDCHFDIMVLFKDGDIVKGSVGYITNGVESNDELIVSKNDVKLVNIGVHVY